MKYRSLSEISLKRMEENILQRRQEEAEKIKRAENQALLLSFVDAIRHGMQNNFRKFSN